MDGGIDGAALLNPEGNLRWSTAPTKDATAHKQQDTGTNSRGRENIVKPLHVFAVLPVFVFLFFLP